MKYGIVTSSMTQKGNPWSGITDVIETIILADYDDVRDTNGIQTVEFFSYEWKKNYVFQ